jgi:hypothetical protein
MMEYSVILFPSANYSIWTARLLKKAGIERRMMPIPRDLSSDCGYCVRIRSLDAEKAKEVLQKGGVEFVKIEKLIQFPGRPHPRPLSSRGGETMDKP